ncbi:thioredoxin reductase [Trichophyton mentagrophytes]|nr:Sulphydryl oxidase Sox [Trichophyton interdigitale]KAG5216815.1 Sulphydryl oxidase Sox [Trichophyton interdigitale]KAG8205355.1 Sulphydryl oxidase Sox [Trichophyton interdigitale]GBF60528.1 thioredoxin reductase [Trichophyton mentagrophytes]
MGVQSFALALIALTSALTSVIAAPIVHDQPPLGPEHRYDVIVVGGGPSGLSALSSLGRVRRHVLLFDEGIYRNGVEPKVFRAKAREQISRYNSTSIKDVKVTKITKVFERGNRRYFFQVTDKTGAIYTASKIVLGTGVLDVLPPTPGLLENFGKGIYWCPWCDGWEHRDQPLGILGSLRHVMESVYELETLNKDIIAFVNGTEHNVGDITYLNLKYPQWRKQLQNYNVKINNKMITSIDRLQDGSKVYDKKNWQEYDKFRINFSDGTSEERGVFITNFPTEQHSDLPDQLGLARDPVDKNKIKVNFRGMRSSVPGVFVVGDANNDGSTNGNHAMFSGKRAAVALHVELERERAEIALGKRDESFSEANVEKEALELIGRDTEELEELWGRK